MDVFFCFRPTEKRLVGPDGRVMDRYISTGTRR